MDTQENIYLMKMYSKTDVQNITKDLPDAYIKMFDESKLKDQVKLAYALMLYKQEDASISKAAEIAGMDIYEFMFECKKHGLTTLDTEPESLKEELSALKQIA